MTATKLRDGAFKALLLGTLYATTAVSPVLAQDQASTLLWSTDELSNPESVLEDSGRSVLYVSNVNGAPTDKDGNGFIAKLTFDGSIDTLEWIGGMDAPKGMVMDGADTLYVTDIDRLHRIDLNEGTITKTWDAPGAIFLNDPAIAENGDVYVSDIASRTIWRLKDGTMELWLQDDALMHPNGTRVEDGKLLVAGWGRDMQEDGSTLTGGNLFTVDLETREISDLGTGVGIGNLDGLEPDGRGGYLVTDFIAGALHRIQPDGSHEQLLDLDQGSADLEVVENGRIAIIPQMMGNRIDAYDLTSDFAVGSTQAQ